MLTVVLWLLIQTSIPWCPHTMEMVFTNFHPLMSTYNGDGIYKLPSLDIHVQWRWYLFISVVSWVIHTDMPATNYSWPGSDKQQIFQVFGTKRKNTDYADTAEQDGMVKHPSDLTTFWCITSHINHITKTCF